MEIFIVSLISIVTLILWIVFFIKFRKQYSPEAVLKNIRIEVDKLLIEISRETDRDITVIENRIASLREITAAADAKIEELSRRIVTYSKETEQRKYEHDVMNSLREEPASIMRKNSPVQRAVEGYKKKSASEMDFSQAYPGFSPEPAVQVSSQQRKNEDARLLNESAQKQVQENPTEKTPSDKSNVEKPSFSVSKDNVLSASNVKRYVVEMAAEGFSADLIAERLGISMTEVEMIMYMYGRS